MANEISKTPTQAKPQVIPLSKIHDLPNVFIAKPQDKSLGSMVLSIESSLSFCASGTMASISSCPATAAAGPVSWRRSRTSPPMSMR